MGPKAKPGGAKKGKDANPENGGELTPEEKAKMFMLTCQSLQIQLCTVYILHMSVFGFIVYFS
jgi:hypothetical protein